MNKSNFRPSLRRPFVATIAGFMLLGVTEGAVAKDFRWAFQSDAVSMDPYTSSETMTNSFLGNIYEGLVRRDENFEFEPALATEWATPEPTKWIFKLRKGVKFHNGNAFNADDVIFSYERVIQETSDIAPLVSGIEAVNKIDDYTVEIITSGPRPVLLSEITPWFLLDKEWAEKNNAVSVGSHQQDKENFATTHANGTGPFILKNREPDVETTLTKNPIYWGDVRSNITTAVFAPIKSPSTRVASFLSGDLDMMYPAPLQDVERLNKTNGLQVLQSPDVRTIFFGLDQSSPELKYSNVKGKNPFKDIRVRKAFYQAIDASLIQEKVMRGASKPTALMVGRGLTGFDETLNNRIPHDPAASKILLTAAGYPDGFEVTLDCPNDRYVNDEAICQAVTIMLAKIGIKVDLNAQTKAKHFAKLNPAKDTSFYMLGWASNSLDAYNTFFNNVASPPNLTAEGAKVINGQGAWNAGGYSNHQIDALLVKIAAETEPKERNRLIRKAMQLHQDDIGHLPLHQQALAWGVKDSIDLVQYPDNSFALRFVIVE